MQNMAKTFTKDSWFLLSTFEQLVYIGRSVNVAINCRKNGDQFGVNEAVAEAIELARLTTNDPKNSRRLSEITKIEMLLVDDFQGNNEYQSTDECWNKYFSFFEHLVKTEQGK